MDIITKVLLKERDKARVMVEAIIDSELTRLNCYRISYDFSASPVLKFRADQ